MNYTNLTTTQILKFRFKGLKEEIKSNSNLKLADFKNWVTDNEKCYNSSDGYQQIIDAWRGRRADIRLTELLAEFKEAVLSNK